ncbi:MAG: HAMP domain-containing histidine kinase, partial [Mollicutes bacterium]|nr:HAMP domain-containing histidine kinase [Mollicutes bacterium]
NEQQRDYLEGALRGSHRLEDSINDLLDMAKIEAGNASLYPTYFSLEDLVLDLEKRLHSLILTKRIDFRIELATGPEKIYGDREKIERILLNLLSNAVKFTPVGGMVSIKAETNDQGLVVQVKDTGLGIKKEDQQYIFDAFRQVDGSTTRAYKGTGLGLAIAKKYVDLHGGFIWVESDLGKGSTFYFTIPKEGIETEVVKDGTEKDFGSG